MTTTQHTTAQPLKKLPIGTRYRYISEPGARYEEFTWTKTGKTTSKLNPNQRVGTRHDNRRVVEVID